MLAGEGDEDQIVLADELVREVVREDGYALLRRDHHEDHLEVGRAEFDVRAVAGRLIEPDEHRVAVGLEVLRRRHIDQILAPQLGAVKLHPPRHRVARVQRRHEPDAVDPPPRHGRLLPEIRAVPGVDDVVAALHESGGELVGAFALERQKRVRVRPPEAPGEDGQLAALVPLQKADVQAPADAGGGVLGAADGAVHLPEKVLRVHVKRLARLRQAHGPPAPVEQLAPDRRLERLYVLRDGRLRDEKRRRRLCEAAALRRRREDLELCLVHGVPLV